MNVFDWKISAECGTGHDHQKLSQRTMLMKITPKKLEKIISLIIGKNYGRGKKFSPLLWILIIREYKVYVISSLHNMPYYGSWYINTHKNKRNWKLIENSPVIFLLWNQTAKEKIYHQVIRWFRVTKNCSPWHTGTRTFPCKKMVRRAWLLHSLALLSRVLFFSFMRLLYKRREKVALNCMQCTLPRK